LRNLLKNKALNPEIIKLKHEGRVSKSGGLLLLTTPFTRRIRTELLKRNVYTDARGSILRIDPAPYIIEQQYINAINILSGIVPKFQK
jgi:hypothetical protein